MQRDSSSTTLRAGLSKRIHAWVMAHLGKKYEEKIVGRKRNLLGGLEGTILEIGPGTGLNLKFYRKGVRWIGVEPNPFMHGYLLEEARRLGIAVDLRTLDAERLPAADESVDAVVSTLVLCSVTDPQQVLREILRVLKPGGRFVYIEHVAAPAGTKLRRLQRWIRPLWKRIGDGCHPDRETWQAIEQAGFAQVDHQHFRLPMGPVSPQIAGVAIK